MRRTSLRRGPLLAAILLLAGVAPARGVECMAPTVEHVVAPSTTDPAIGDPTADHYAYVRPSAPSRGELMVFFPGSCAPPFYYRWFLREAANGGYHAIGLSHPNCPEVNSTCNAQSPIDPDCQEKMRLERLEGVDASPLIDVAPADAIENRLVKLLGWLDAQFPGEEWGQFVDGGSPRWGKLVVSGHSQGAGHAANIGRLHVVARVVMFDWLDFVPGIGVAPWTTKPKATAVERYFGMYHARSFASSVVPAWNLMGVPATTATVPPEPEPFLHANRILTDVPDGTGGTSFHGAVVANLVTPVRGDGTPVLSDAWRYLLGASPDDVVPVPATSLTLRDGSARANPKARKLQFTASTKGLLRRIVAPLPGSAGDPTLHGATLHVFNAAAGGEVASFVLPAASWSLVGTAASPRGWLYRDTASDAPIRRATVKDDRISVTGGRERFCYTLDEPQQVRVGVRVELGSAVAWCADAPGKTDQIDGFRGVAGTPAPAACFMVPRDTGS